MPGMSFFMRGGCYALALRLHRRTGLPLYGLFNGDTLHHAFVADVSQQLGYDARGAVPFDRLVWFQGRACAGQDVRPADVDTVSDLAYLAARLKDGPVSRQSVDRFIRSTPDLVALFSRPRHEDEETASPAPHP